MAQQLQASIQAFCEGEARAKNITRNFAIDLLQRLNIEPHQLQEAFEGHAEACAAPQPDAGVPQLSKHELFVLIDELLGGGFRGAKAWRRKVRTKAASAASDPAREVLRQQLDSLFDAIDVDENGYITFDQLLSFLIECTMKGRVEATHNIHSYNITEAYSLHLHDTGMTHMRYVPQHDMLCAATEAGIVRTWDLSTLCREHRFIDPLVVPPKQGQQRINCGAVGVKLMQQPPVERNQPYEEHQLQGGKILCSTFIPTYRLLGVSSADSHTRLFCPKTRKVKCTFKNEESQVSIAWCERSRLFYSAGRSGSIAAYRLRFLRDNMRTNNGDAFDGDTLGVNAIDSATLTTTPVTHFSTQPHESPVQALYTLPNGRVASASLDPALHVQEPTRGDIVVSCGGMTAGLLALGFSRDNGLILAGGFQSHILAWGWAVGGNRPLRFIDQTTPHATPVVGVVAVEGTPQVISGDQSGMVKVWDVRKLACVQTLTRAQHFEMSNKWGDQSAFASMMYIPDRRLILASSRKRLVFYGYCHSRDRNEQGTVDGAPIVPPRYLRESQLLLTGAGRRVRFWELASGSLCASFTDVIEEGDRLTTLAVDPLGSMFYVGTQDGYVKGFTTSNGVERHSIQPCKGEEIRCLEVMPLREGFKFLLGISWGGSVFSYNICSQGVSDGGFMSLTSSVFAKQLTLGRSYAFDPDNHIYVIGIRGAFSVWRVTTSYKHNNFQPVYLGTVRTRYQHPISCLSFLDSDCGLVAVAIGHGQQMIQLWSIHQRPPSEQAKTVPLSAITPRLIIEWRATAHTHPLTCFAHNKDLTILYAACEKGKVSAYPLAPVIAAFRQRVAQEPLPDASTGLVHVRQQLLGLPRSALRGKDRKDRRISSPRSKIGLARSRASMVARIALGRRSSSKAGPDAGLPQQRGSVAESPERQGLLRLARLRASDRAGESPYQSPNSDTRSVASDEAAAPARSSRRTTMRAHIFGSPAIDPETGLPLDNVARRASLRPDIPDAVFGAADFRVTAIAQISAHDDGAIGLTAVQWPRRVLVSSGFDRCIRLWNPLLKGIGHLDPYRGDRGYQIKGTTMAPEDEAELARFEKAMVVDGVREGTPELDVGTPDTRENSPLHTRLPSRGSMSSRGSARFTARDREGNGRSVFSLTELGLDTSREERGDASRSPRGRSQAASWEHTAMSTVGELGVASPTASDAGMQVLPEEVQRLLAAESGEVAEKKKSPCTAGIFRRAAHGVRAGLRMRTRSPESDEDFDAVAEAQNTRYRMRRRRARAQRHTDRCGHFLTLTAEEKVRDMGRYEDLAEDGANLFDMLLRVCQETVRGQHSIVRQTKQADRVARERRRRHNEVRRLQLEMGIDDSPDPPSPKSSPQTSPKEQLLATKQRKQAMAEETIAKVWRDLQVTRDPILASASPCTKTPPPMPKRGTDPSQQYRVLTQGVHAASPETDASLGALPSVFKRPAPADVQELKRFRHPKGKRRKRQIAQPIFL